MDIDKMEITEEMLEKVALAQLYREDATLALRKIVTGKLSSSEMDRLYRRVLQDSRFQEVKKDAIKLEEMSLIDDDIGTVKLFYNKLLRDAQYEKKYEVAARILGEITKLEEISKDDTKFEVVFKVEKPEDN